MDRGAERGFLVEHRVELLLVADVELVEGNILPGDLLHALKRLLGAVAEIVNDHDLMAGFQDFDNVVSADEAGASSNKNLHIRLSPFDC